MKIGEYVLYEATHNDDKVKRFGRVRWVEPNWLDVTWLWTNARFDDHINNSTTVMRKYCTPLTKEVADIILFNNEKE